MINNPNYDEASNRTRWPAVSPAECDEMAAKHGWKQPQDVTERYDLTGADILKVDCVSVGNCEFPQSQMDLTQGDSDDD